MDIDLLIVDGTTYFTVLYCGDEIVFNFEEEAKQFIAEMEQIES